MMRRGRQEILVWFIVIFVFIVTTAGNWSDFRNVDTATPLSPTDFIIDANHNQIIVAQKTGKRIDFVDLTSGEIVNTISTSLYPTGICLGQPNIAYVTCSFSEGEVLIVDVEKHEVLEKLPAGHGAIAPVYSLQTDKLYVANQYDDDISVIDLKTNKEISRISVLRQPMTMDITLDGKWLYVANFLPATRADIDTVASDVTIIDLLQNKVLKHIKLSNGSNALRGLKISPDGKHAFVSHNLGRFQVPTSQLEQGWMNTSALSILDAGKHESIATILLDEPEHGAAASWGIDVSDSIIVVNHAGTHDYSEIDYQKMMTMLNQVEDKEMLSYDLRFLNDLRQRFTLSGEGPRAIKIHDRKVFSALYFSDAIQVQEIGSGQMLKKYSLNPQLTLDSVRLGEMAFNDARYCFQQWQACTGCHPNDARTDGLNWDLLNDGIGNPKNCKSMLYAHETPPAMITGIRPDAETAVRAGFRHIQFAQVEESRARAVDLYLRSLEPVPSPFLVDDQLSKLAQKGKVIFEKKGCGYCHSGEYYTDGKKHIIGMPGASDRTDEWDTPTLIEVWRTGPYLHDGRSATMSDVFKVEKHGLTEELANSELEALVEYVLSL